MPYVNVKITRGDVTPAQKRHLVEDITRSLVQHFGKKPEHIHIVIDEVDPQNWGYAGVLTSDLSAAASPRRPKKDRSDRSKGKSRAS